MKTFMTSYSALYKTHPTIILIELCNSLPYGVIELIRISAAGFASRWFYKDFLNVTEICVSIVTFNGLIKKRTGEKKFSNISKENDKFKFDKEEAIYLFTRLHSEMSFQEDVKDSVWITETLERIFGKTVGG